MSSDLSRRLNGMDLSDMNLKELIQKKEWKDVVKKIEVVIAEMNPDMLSYCQDKISNIYDKYLNVEGEPNYEEAAKIIETFRTFESVRTVATTELIENYKEATDDDEAEYYIEFDDESVIPITKISP